MYFHFALVISGVMSLCFSPGAFVTVTGGRFAGGGAAKENEIDMAKIRRANSFMD